MKINKVIGLLLLVLTATTVVGMVLNNNAYWQIYNFGSIIISAGSAVALLKQK